MKRVVYRSGVGMWLAAIMVLSLGSVTVVEAQDDEERLFWESVRCHEEKEVRLYLEEYPSGAYVDQATECLQDTARSQDDTDSEQGGDEPARRGGTPELVPIEGGCFQMGSGRQHRVCVEDFSIGKYEVTQGQWEAVMGDNPSEFQGPDRPVEQVSWQDVQGYIDKLNARTGKAYRLPTEAEWEYACRSGGKPERYCGGDYVSDLAWYKSNGGGETHPVGRKRANGLGLYDMSGNVYEWTCSTYDAPSDGNDPNDGRQNRCASKNAGGDRVLRGGSWNFEPLAVRSGSHIGFDPDFRGNFIGFRIAHD